MIHFAADLTILNRISQLIQEIQFLVNKHLFKEEENILFKSILLQDTRWPILNFVDLPFFKNLIILLFYQQSNPSPQTVAPWLARNSTFKELVSRLTPRKSRSQLMEPLAISLLPPKHQYPVISKPEPVPPVFSLPTPNHKPTATSQVLDSTTKDTVSPTSPPKQTVVSEQL